MLFLRMYRAAKLDAKVYSELGSDPIAFAQGVVVVVLVFSALLIGTSLNGLAGGDVGESLQRALFIMPGLWLIQATSAFVIGTFSTNVEERKKLDMRTFAAAIGFSSAPGLLFLFSSVPVVGPSILGIVVIWMAASMVVAVRSAARASLTRAILSVLLGSVLGMFILAPLVPAGDLADVA